MLDFTWNENFMEVTLLALNFGEYYVEAKQANPNEVVKSDRKK